MASADVQIPSHHKAIVYDKPGEISTKIETIETPKPGVGEVLINLTHSGVCHSDQAVMCNRWKWLPAPTQAGQVGGHEGVGTVVAFGEGAEASGLKIGQRVGIKWMAYACLNCLACMSGRDACCPNGKISGFFTPGTFQRELSIDDVQVKQMLIKFLVFRVRTWSGKLRYPNPRWAFQ